MSFSTQVKEELNLIQIKNNCCKKAYILGVVLSAEVIDGLLVVKLTDKSTIEQFTRLLKIIYKVDPIITKISRGCYSATEFKFRSPKLLEFINFADSFSDTEVNIEKLNTYFVCNNCKQVFLRAIFCAKGSVSDPEKSYTLEIMANNDTRSMFIHTVLEEIGPEAPGITSRKGKYGIFYRNESAIEDTLTLFGANKSLFTFFDVHIEKDLRNSENRATNCVTKNIEKSVVAAGIQIEAIEALISNGMLVELSEDIRTTAKLRIENPDMSLGELADMHTPPISKSGLNHRLTKIIELAKKRKLM